MQKMEIVFIFTKIIIIKSKTKQKIRETFSMSSIIELEEE